MSQVTFTREVKQQWINALRSGDYKQGRGTLYRPSENVYCCLGVLAELNGMIDGVGCTAAGCCGHLYTVSDDTGSAVSGLTVGNQLSLARMNDEGITFTEIADYIDQNVPAVDEE